MIQQNQEKNAASDLSVHEILRDAVPEAAGVLSVRARDVLVRMSACRTVALGRRRYDCDSCDEPVRVYNSCGERHCPQCSGRVRADWLERTALRLVPQTPYLQVVFTVPAQLSDLLLANRVPLYSILIATAWKQLKALLESLGVQAAGLIVLHTWNQRLGHHAHLHVLIPCGALSLDGSRWLEVDQRPQLKAGNQWTLGKRFRTALVQQIQKLAACGKLNLSGKLEFLQDPEVRRDWLAGIAPHGFRVFVQPPPSDNTDPEIVLKYLAAYVSGGPIANGRLVSRQDRQVTFRRAARSRQSPASAERRWTSRFPKPSSSVAGRYTCYPRALPACGTTVRRATGIAKRI